MSKVSRADHAASVSWEGVLNKPPGLGGPVDISQLTGSGFANGQIPAWNSALRRFRPSTPSVTPAPTPTPTNPLSPQVQVSWDVPSLLPLQSAYEDFPMIGAVPGTPVVEGLSQDVGFVWTKARIIANDSVRLYAMNMEATTVDLGPVLWNLQLLPDV